MTRAGVTGQMALFDFETIAEPDEPATPRRPLTRGPSKPHIHCCNSLAVQESTHDKNVRTYLARKPQTAQQRQMLKAWDLLPAADRERITAKLTAVSGSAGTLAA